MPTAPISSDHELLSLIADHQYYPDKLAMILWEWGEGELAGIDHPDAWQMAELRELGEDMRATGFNGVDSVRKILRSVGSGRGIGKSADVGMTVTILLAAFPDAKITVMANSGDQLATKTWPEIRKWMRRSIVNHWFESNSSIIYRLGARDSWFAVPITWNLENPQASAGQQNIGSVNVIVFDEASEIPDKIAEVSLSGLTTGLPIALARGNPTMATGFFADSLKGTYAFGTWKSKTIDSRTCRFPNKEEIDEDIEHYGIDSDYVRVWRLGLPPKSNMEQFFDEPLIEASMRRKPHGTQMDALVAAVDFAWGGCFDGETEILTNQGWKLFAALSGDEHVLTLDGDVSRWGPITALHKYWHDGPMNQLERRSQNFCITDNHQLLVQSSIGSRRYAIKRYDALKKHFLVRGTNTWGGTTPEIIRFTTVKLQPHGGTLEFEQEFRSLDFAVFLGWFVAEGNVHWSKPTSRYPHPRPAIELSQRHPLKRKIIENVLGRMGFSATYWSKHGTIRVSGKALAEWLDRNCGVKAANKRIPRWVMDGSVEIIRVFLDAFRAGDGTERKNGMGRTYSTSSALLADDIQECLAKLGCAGKKTRVQASGTETRIETRRVMRKHDQWVIYEKSNRADVMIFKRNVKRIEYHGWVWCVSTPLQTICVRRRGIVMWSGNSDPNKIRFRHGLDAWSIPPITIPGEQTKTPEHMIGVLANVLNREWPAGAAGRMQKVAMLFMDSAGIAGPVALGLRNLGFASRICEVNFGAHAMDMLKHKNMRAQMIDAVKQLMQKGLGLDDCKTMREDMRFIQPVNYVPLQFMKKEEVRKLLAKVRKGGRNSTDDLDALAMTTYMPVVVPAIEQQRYGYQQMERPYVPASPYS